MKEKKVKLEDIKDDQLPDDLKKMKPEERKAHVEKLQKERDELKKKALDLDKKRLEFIAKKQAEDIKARMVAGSFDIFKDGLKDNKGALVVPAGKSYKQTDLELEKMNYLVEGVVGSL